MASRSPDKPALVSAYRKLTGDTRARVLRHAQQQWEGMDSWSDSAADQLVAQLLPVLTAGQRVVSSATAAFLRTWLDVPGSRTGLLDVEQVTGTALRGVDPAVVYRRPVIESRATFARLRKTDLDRQQVIDAAIDTGLRRLLGTASTDLQLTATLTSRQVLRAEKVKVYRRVTRAGACPLCLAASDRVYHTGDLLPIHANCHCIVVPGGVLPEALQRASNADDPTGGRGLQIGENAEIGPVLEWGDKTKGAGRRRSAAGGGSSGGGGATPPTPAAGQPDDFPELGRIMGLDIDGDQIAERPAAMSADDAVRFSLDEDFTAKTEVPEKRTADWLRSLGMTVRKVRNVQNRKTPDAVITSGYWSGKTAEFKTATSLNALRNQIDTASEQSPQVVVELTGDYPDPAAVAAAIRLGIQQASGRLDEIVVRHPNFQVRWRRAQ